MQQIENVKAFVLEAKMKTNQPSSDDILSNPQPKGIIYGSAPDREPASYFETNAVVTGKPKAAPRSVIGKTLRLIGENLRILGEQQRLIEESYNKIGWRFWLFVTVILMIVAVILVTLNPPSPPLPKSELVCAGDTCWYACGSECQLHQFQLREIERSLYLTRAASDRDLPPYIIEAFPTLPIFR